MELKSLYEMKPWVQSYPQGVPSNIEISNRSVNEAFDEAAEKWKGKTAIIFYGQKISYQELRNKVNKFAAALFHLGIKKGDRVAFLLLNSPEHIIAFYGALKAGAIITPISPVYVSKEIKHQLEDSRAETIICQDMLYEAVERTGLKLKNVIMTNISESLPAVKRLMGRSVVRTVYEKMAVPSPKIFKQEGFYQFQDLIQKSSGDPPKIGINAEEDIALLPYTSGTTGLPKGVMLTHQNLIASLEQFHAFYPIHEEGKEVLIGYTPFYHVAGQVLAVLDGILYGYTQVILTTPDLDDILSVISKYNVTSLFGAPSLFELLKDYKKTDRVNWKSIKIIISGADALHERTARDWKSRTGVDLHEGYGMTETSGITHMSPLGRGIVGSFGIPVPNTLVAIMDPDKDEFQPPESLGELVVSGLQVTKGYWNNPEATKECEAVIDGKRWWRTGDLAKMDKDGYFYIYDRKRDLIKYKGLRVYAREVEEVLKTHPKIKEVGVIGVPDIKVGENVKAFVVLETDARGKLSEEEIREYCKDKLAHYKIPKVVEFVGEVPKTDVGKVSRRELREQEESLK